MSERSRALVTLAVLLAAAVAHAIWAYPSLPDPLASHFDIAGRADGFQAKRDFFTLYALLLVAMSGTFVGLAYLIPRLPTSLINLPNRDVHLAPDRRDATLAEITGYIAWMGVATVALMAWVMHLVFRANLAPGEPATGLTFLVSLGGYLLLVLVWTVRFYRRYSAVRAG